MGLGIIYLDSLEYLQTAKRLIPRPGTKNEKTEALCSVSEEAESETSGKKELIIYGSLRLLITQSDLKKEVKDTTN